MVITGLACFSELEIITEFTAPNEGTYNYFESTFCTFTDELILCVVLKGLLAVRSCTCFEFGF